MSFVPKLDLLEPEGVFTDFFVLGDIFVLLEIGSDSVMRLASSLLCRPG